MSRLIFNKETGLDLNCSLCLSGDEKILHSYEELTNKISPDIVMYYINEIRIINIIELIRIKKKVNCRILLCIMEIKPDYLTLLEELGIKDIFYREGNCEKCKNEIKLVYLLNDFIYSLLEAKHFCIYTKKVLQTIREKGFETDLNSIATELKISSEHLSRIFKKDTGKCFRDFNCDLKFEISKKLLKEDNLHITVVASLMGYSEVTNFYRFLKKIEIKRKSIEP